MEGRLLLKDCCIFRADGRVKSGMAVLVKDGRVAQVAPNPELPVLPGDWEVSCRGRMVAAGLVDCHAHSVAHQLLPQTGELILRGSKARDALLARILATLSPDEVQALASFAFARAARSGVTLLVEHLQSPADVRGGLMAFAQAAERMGMRVLLSHATSSREGPAPLDQVEANAEVVRAYRAHPTIRAALGFGASSAAEDELLRKLGRLREELGAGVHFHLAETQDDLTETYERFGKRIVPRLETFGLLGPGVVAAFGRAASRAEADRLAKSRTLLALCPTQEALSESLGTGLEAVMSSDHLIGLGSGGGRSLWDELGAALGSTLRIARSGRLLDPDGFLAQLLISGPAELCSMAFGAPSGTVEAGCLADLVVFDLVPTRWIQGDAVTPILLHLAGAPVAWTIVGGRVVVREGQLLSEDFVDLAHEARKAAESVWARVS